MQEGMVSTVSIKIEVTWIRDVLWGDDVFELQDETDSYRHVTLNLMGYYNNYQQVTNILRVSELKKKQVAQAHRLSAIETKAEK
ncbi:hypothetical protein PIB30_051567 [Stylosanthes scabra]|uniref:Uncharacterized protein n=1 Tax=Stylosanthes scabra TaxID=79078 RepID=A0ABU6RI56_9FABA|nr:hypothetical protein [Stylosanthes scabra]